jgi:hypothetical protein
MYEKRANKARKDLTLLWGFGIMDLNNERRLNPLSMGTAPVWGQQLKSPCEAHGMVRWGSPKTPSQKQYRFLNL